MVKCLDLVRISLVLQLTIGVQCRNHWSTVNQKFQSLHYTPSNLLKINQEQSAGNSTLYLTNGDANKIVKQRTLLDIEDPTLLAANNIEDTNLASEVHKRVKRSRTGSAYFQSDIPYDDRYLQDLANSFPRNAQTGNDSFPIRNKEVEQGKPVTKDLISFSIGDNKLDHKQFSNPHKTPLHEQEITRNNTVVEYEDTSRKPFKKFQVKPGKPFRKQPLFILTNADLQYPRYKRYTRNKKRKKPTKSKGYSSKKHQNKKRRKGSSVKGFQRSERANPSDLTRNENISVSQKPMTHQKRNEEFREKRDSRKENESTRELKYYEDVREPEANNQQTTTKDVVTTKSRENRAIKSIGEIKELAEKLTAKVSDLQRYLNEETRDNRNAEGCSPNATGNRVSAKDGSKVNEGVPLNAKDTLSKLADEKKENEGVRKGKETKRHPEKGSSKSSDTSKGNQGKRKLRRWDKWTDWSSCSVTCGKGRQIRWRHCTEDCNSVETEMEEKACQLPACPPGRFLGIF